MHTETLRECWARVCACADTHQFSKELPDAVWHGSIPTRREFLTRRVHLCLLDELNLPDAALTTLGVCEAVDGTELGALPRQRTAHEVEDDVHHFLKVVPPRL